MGRNTILLLKVLVVEIADLFKLRACKSKSTDLGLEHQGAIATNVVLFYLFRFYDHILLISFRNYGTTIFVVVGLGH